MKSEKYARWGAALLQLVKFGIVGVSNTAISYGIEMLCYYILFANISWSESIRVLATSVLAFAVSVTNSYYWNNRYVFGRKIKKTFWQHLTAYLKTVACYGVTGLLMAPAIKLYATSLGIPFWLSSLGSLVITIPLNFILNKFWAFRKSGGSKE